jgi:hypothetical protein
MINSIRLAVTIAFALIIKESVVILMKLSLAGLMVVMLVMGSILVKGIEL